jgi:hypothetical protein
MLPGVFSAASRSSTADPQVGPVDLDPDIVSARQVERPGNSPVVLAPSIPPEQAQAALPVREARVLVPDSPASDPDLRLAPVALAVRVPAPAVHRLRGVKLHVRSAPRPRAAAAVSSIPRRRKAR